MAKNFLYVDPTTGDYFESTGLGAFEVADFINTSAGVADAGKPIVLDASGKISNTMLNIPGVTIGIQATVGTGGLALADLAYFSAADTVRRLDPTNTTPPVQYGVGLAIAPYALGATASLVSKDYLITGLSGLVAGTKYYWTLSGISATPPAANGNMVWEVGIAKNATTLAVNVQFVKKNKAA